jgi:hypothetical protein
MITVKAGDRWMTVEMSHRELYLIRNYDEALVFAFKVCDALKAWPEHRVVTAPRDVHGPTA